MTLIDRLTAEDDTKIPAHGFSAALFLHAIGKLTRQEIIDKFALSVEDQVQLDQLRAGRATLAQPEMLYAKQVEAVAVLAEGGFVAKAEVAGLLDI